MENALTNPLKATFADQAQPSGTEQDWFRFSTARSASGWNLSGDTQRGTYLGKLYWDFATNRDIATNYYDPKSTAYVIRSHKFASHVTSSRSVIVGFELKRPDEDTSSSSAITRSVTVTVNQPPQPLVNSITGPDMINVTGSYSWLAVASGGIPPYSYGAWYYYQYPGPEQQVETGQSYGRTITVEPSGYVFRLRNFVTDQTPQTKQAKYFVDVFPAGGFAASAGNGVLFADGSCRPRPTDHDAHQAWLAGLFDAHKNVEPCHLR